MGNIENVGTLRSLMCVDGLRLCDVIGRDGAPFFISTKEKIIKSNQKSVEKKEKILLLIYLQNGGQFSRLPVERSERHQRSFHQSEKSENGGKKKCSTVK